MTRAPGCSAIRAACSREIAGRAGCGRGARGGARRHGEHRRGAHEQAEAGLPSPTPSPCLHDRPRQAAPAGDERDHDDEHRIRLDNARDGRHDGWVHDHLDHRDATTTTQTTTTTSSSTSAALPHGTEVDEHATGQQSPFYAMDAYQRTLAAGTIHFNIYNYDQDPHTLAIADSHGHQSSDTVPVPAGHTARR